MRRLVPRYVLPITRAIAVAALLALLVFGAVLLRDAPTAPTAPPVTHERLEAYEGLGSWIDLWDARAWRDPAATVADMSRHGVRTIYIQTGNARSAGGIANPSAMRRFITEAHARDMLVVAWYLPSLKPGSVDLTRVVQAVEFRTEDGQKFDSFALDIESTAVKPLAARNRSLATLSEKIRARVGDSYPLGAIIPSPVGLRKQSGFWNVFPYESVAETYDVLLPMAYYTYHGQTAEQAGADAAASMSILRSQPGCSDVPVHLIGGIAGKSSAAEVLEFTLAARASGCIGASIYDWAGMSGAKWNALEAGWRTPAE